MHRYVWSTWINYISCFYLEMFSRGFFYYWGLVLVEGSEDTVGLFLETFSDPVKAASHPGRIVMLFYFAKKQTV